MISKTRRRCIAVVAALLCATPAAGREHRGTPEQRAACGPDAFRLCAGYIPDPTRVEQCLRQSKSELSDACRLVFEQSAGPMASRSK
jgi:hypothetical protein